MARNDTPRSYRFTDDELELLEAGKKKHGSYKAALINSLRADLAKPDPKPLSNADLLDLLKARLK